MGAIVWNESFEWGWAINGNYKPNERCKWTHHAFNRSLNVRRKRKKKMFRTKHFVVHSIAKWTNFQCFWWAPVKDARTSKINWPIFSLHEKTMHFFYIQNFIYLMYQFFVCILFSNLLKHAYEKLIRCQSPTMCEYVFILCIRYKKKTMTLSIIFAFLLWMNFIHIIQEISLSHR